MAILEFLAPFVAVFTHKNEEDITSRFQNKNDLVAVKFLVHLNHVWTE